MPILTLVFLPVATLTAAGIALVGLCRGDDELARHASTHMAAYALANIACWFAL
jgi:hypothetical protein